MLKLQGDYSLSPTLTYQPCSKQQRNWQDKSNSLSKAHTCRPGQPSAPSDLPPPSTSPRDVPRRTEPSVTREEEEKAAAAAGTVQQSQVAQKHSPMLPHTLHYNPAWRLSLLSFLSKLPPLFCVSLHQIHSSHTYTVNCGNVFLAEEGVRERPQEREWGVKDVDHQEKT